MQPLNSKQALYVPPTGAAISGEWSFLRIDAPLAAPGPQVKLLLDWLSCQRGMLPRALFVSRDGSVAMAGDRHQALPWL
eukprot:s5159_g1.t1